MEEERWSPIMGLRNRLDNNGGNGSSGGNSLRRQTNFTDDAIHDCVPGYLPFRMQAAVPRYRHRVRIGGLLGAMHSRHKVVGTFQKRKQILSNLKKQADRLKDGLPTFTDVNRIDKCSRLAFPSLFLIFNIGYWCFYVFQ